MYKGNKPQTGGTQQQIKNVYIVQEGVWRVTVQWGSVNRKGTFFVVEHSIVKDYSNYFDAALAVAKYVNNSSPAKPVFSCSNVSSARWNINVDCLSEPDTELAEQYANAREGGEDPGGNFW